MSETTFADLMTQARTGHVDFPGAWGQGRAIYGGAVAGAALARLRAASEVGGRPPVALAVHLAGPVNVGGATVTRRVLRAGKNMTHAAAEVVQGATVATVTASFGAPRSSEVGIVGPRMPPNLDRESTTRFPYIEGVTPAFTRNFEMRWVGNNFPFTGSDRAGITGFARHTTVAEGPEGLIGLLDVWPPPVLPILSRPAFGSTVTWSAELRRPNADPSGWFVYSSETTWAHEGHCRFDARMWTESGELVTTSTQLAAVFA